MRRHPDPSVEIGGDLGNGEVPPAPLRNTCEIRRGRLEWLRAKAHRPVLPPRGRHYSTAQSSGAPRAPSLPGSAAAAPPREPAPRRVHHTTMIPRPYRCMRCPPARRCLYSGVRLSAAVGAMLNPVSPPLVCPWEDAPPAQGRERAGLRVPRHSLTTHGVVLSAHGSP